MEINNLGARQGDRLDQVARVRDKQNANHWIDFASKHNKPEIIKEVNLHLASTGKANATTSTATHLKSYKLHDDQDSTVDAAIKKAKQASGTQDDSVALENICLDYLGGHTFAHRTRAIGPTRAPPRGSRTLLPSKKTWSPSSRSSTS